MHLNKVFFAKVMGVFLVLWVLLITVVFTPTSFLLRKYPDVSEFDVISRIYLMNATGQQSKITHIRTSDASFTPPKRLLPHLIYLRKKALQGAMRISIGKPSTRIETFCVGTIPADTIIQWYVLDGKVVNFNVVNKGVQTNFNVIEFTKTARQWILFLKPIVGCTPDKEMQIDALISDKE